MLPEEFPAPIGKLLGLTITTRGGGRASVEFEASRRYANPMGTLHGGVLCDLADAAMGLVYLSTLIERRDGHHYRIENQLPTTSLERKTSS